MTIQWPFLLAPASIDPRIVSATKGGGRSISGLEQVVGTDAGFWELDLISVPIMDAPHVKVYYAIDALLSGRSAAIDVPFFTKILQPWPVVNGQQRISTPSVPFDDDTMFDDDTEFWQNVIAASVTDAALLRATTIAITMDYGTSDDMPGSIFTPEGATERRGYKIGKIVSSVGNDHVVTIKPPLREALSAGQELDFDRPSCLMRLASDDGMTAPLSHGKFGNPTVKFVEAL